jgi:hypothetical protein
MAAYVALSNTGRYAGYQAGIALELQSIYEQFSYFHAYPPPFGKHNLELHASFAPNNHDSQKENLERLLRRRAQSLSQPPKESNGLKLQLAIIIRLVVLSLTEKTGLLSPVFAL